MLLEPSNGSNYQACAALTSLPDPVWAYIHFKVKIVEEKGSLTINKVDAETGKALAGVTYRLFDANGKKVADMTTGADGKAVFKDLPQGKYSYQEISAPSGYVVDNTKYQITITATALNITQREPTRLPRPVLRSSRWTLITRHRCKVRASAYTILPASRSRRAIRMPTAS